MINLLEKENYTTTWYGKLYQLLKMGLRKIKQQQEQKKIINKRKRKIKQPQEYF